MARIAAAVVALAALMVGCGGGTKPHFDSASGWHLLSGNAQLLAANVPFAASARSLAGPPAGTVARLPRSGTVIWVIVNPAIDTDPTRRRLPVRLDQTRPSTTFEGVRCAPAVTLSNCYAASGSVRHLVGTYGSHDVDLYIFFGTDRPSRAQRASASAELARLRL